MCRSKVVRLEQDDEEDDEEEEKEISVVYAFVGTARKRAEQILDSRHTFLIFPNHYTSL